MLKVALAAGAVLVAAIWAFCAFLWMSPLEPEHSPTAARPEAASAGVPAVSTRVPAPSAAAPATATPAPSAVTQTAAPSLDGPAPVQSATGRVVGTAQAPLPSVATAPPFQADPTPTAPGKAAPQLTAVGGYVFDGDSVVVAPPVSSDAPSSVAEQQRRTRLTTDISKIP